MKSSLLVVAALALLASALPLLSARKNRGDEQGQAQQEILQKKRFSIRCSPLYVPSADNQIPALAGWGNYRWKIKTSSDSAQFYFDQGINMYYAFHIIESRASFEKGTYFDPKCAMLWWGKALAYGPNINDFEYQQPVDAYACAMKAKVLSEENSAAEKALIDAMAVRYSDDASVSQSLLNEKYTSAMEKVYERYKSHPEVPTLYADALMLLHPWDLYEHDFTPKKWTPEIVSVLKDALKANPKHPGANHLFIHAVEASANPEQALKSAEWLCSAMPSVSHVTHMPSHVYIRSGYYNKGIVQNDKALVGYNTYLASFPATEENIALYSLHNLHMKMSCAHMAVNYKQAIDAANALQQSIPDFYLSIPGPLANYVQYLHQSPLLTQIRFGKWDDILKEKVNDTLLFVPVLQHFGRGLAFVKKNDLKNAETELSLLRKKMEQAELKEPLAPFNSAYDAAVVAEKILTGVFYAKKNDFQKAISNLKEAVAAEDKMIYNEPKDWLLPARHYLAQALFASGKAEDAIAVLKKDLQINPNNGWSLTELINCYNKTNKTNAAATAKQQLKNALVASDTKISSAAF